VPVVCTAVGGILNAVRDGVDGLLVAGVPPDPRTSPAPVVSEYAARFAAAIARVLDEPGLGQRLAERALRRARTELSLDGMASSYRRLYDEVLDAPASARRASAIG
jgi:glycosyltransferase involved in cell wall biosynthesis